MKKLIALVVLVAASVGIVAYPTTDTTISLTKTNFVSLRDVVNPNSIDAVFEGIYKSNPKNDFYITLDSPGGDVFSGMRLVRFLQTTDRNITCVATTAISMAFIILQSCKKRVVLDTAVLMAHGISANLGSQNLNGLKNHEKVLQGLEDMVNNLIASRLKLTVAEYLSKLNPEYWLIGGTSILQGNAADSVSNIKCEKEVEEATEKYLVPTPFGTVESTRPLCPF